MSRSAISKRHPWPRELGDLRADWGGRFGGVQLGDDGADVAQAGEYTVELRLVGDRDGKGGGAVVVAGQVERIQPGRPVVVEVAVDVDRVRRGGGVHQSAPAGWGLM